jgi:hypothetical protein
METSSSTCILLLAVFGMTLLLAATSPNTAEAVDYGGGDAG